MWNWDDYVASHCNVSLMCVLLEFQERKKGVNNISFGSSSLENGFILVEAQLLLPVEYAFRRLFYKYVVWKEKTKDKDKYVWEHLVGFDVHSNRCLLIPKARCESGGNTFFYILIFV